MKHRFSPRSTWCFGILGILSVCASTYVFASCPDQEAWGPTLNNGDGTTSTCYCQPSNTAQCSTSNKQSDCVNVSHTLTGKFCCHYAAGTECLSQAGSNADCYEDLTCAWDTTGVAHCAQTVGTVHSSPTNTTASCGS